MRRRLHSTTVPRVTKKQQLLELAAQRGWQRIGEAEWALIRAAMPNVAPEDLQGAGLPADAPWCGVRQHTLGELEQTLGALSAVYVARPDLRKFTRAVVVRAKERAKWASRSAAVAAEKRALKAEMAEWMLVWLSDPDLFPAWVALRRRALSATHPG